MFLREKINKKNLKYPKDVMIGKKKYNIDVLLLDKKSSSVSIKDDTIVFRMSLNLSLKDFNKSFNYLLKKIIVKMQSMSNDSQNKLSSKYDYPKDIQINDKKYYIEVIFSKKRSSSVSIKNDVIVFRMSSYLNEKQFQEHFANLLKRIVKKEEIKTSQMNYFTFKEVLDRGYFKFSNEIYRLKYERIKGVKLSEENIICVNPQIDNELLEKKIIKLLINKYENRIMKYVKEVNNSTYKFLELGKVCLKYVNSKWGHCTYKNDIMINLKLLNAPIEILNYVIIHELAHIKHKNHSISFWKEVEKFCPNHKKIRKDLKLLNPELYY